MHYRLFALFLVLTPSLALAHSGLVQPGFGAGFMHPLMGLDHLLAIVGIGLWSAQQTTARGMTGIYLAFMAAMLFGFGLGYGAVPLPLVEFGIAGSLLVTGVLVFGARRLPLFAAAALAGAFALFHGHAHGTEMAAGVSAMSFVLGFAMVTTLLIGAGLLSGRTADRLARSRPLARGTGAVLMAASVYMLVMA